MSQAANYNSFDENSKTWKTPCYDGRDTHLNEQPYCYTCKDPTAELKKCSRCSVAWYCSVECQKKHLKQHRDICKTIAEERNGYKEEELRLL
jgi:hypothetical protein